MSKTDLSQEKVKQEIVITRVFNASRERVWQAWTDAELLKRWWGPASFTTPVYKLDLRVGGKFHFCMRTHAGQDTWATGVFREIVPLERLVYTDSFADEHGNVVPATHYGMGTEFPMEMLVTVTFEEDGKGRTLLTLRHAGLPAGEMSDQSAVGWNESLDKLAVYLK